MPYTAFPIEGNLGAISNEGAVIKLSCSKLSKLDGHLGINPEMKHTAENIEKLSDGVAQLMLNLFWFPRIPEDKLIDLSDSEEKLHWERISSEKKYTSGAVPRSNDLNILRDVLHNHIDLIFNCYNNIAGNKEIADKILSKFISLVSNNGMIGGKIVGWQLDDQTTKKLEDSVLKKLYATGAYQPESPESSQKQSTPSSGNSGEVTPEHRSSSDEDYKPSTPDEEVAKERSPYIMRKTK